MPPRAWIRASPRFCQLGSRRLPLSAPCTSGWIARASPISPSAWQIALKASMSPVFSSASASSCVIRVGTTLSSFSLPSACATALRISGALSCSLGASACAAGAPPIAATLSIAADFSAFDIFSQPASASLTSAVLSAGACANSAPTRTSSNGNVRHVIGNPLLEVGHCRGRWAGDARSRRQDFVPSQRRRGGAGGCSSRSMMSTRPLWLVWRSISNSLVASTRLLSLAKP